MARENFTNFGTTALAANITSTSALTFSVTVGQGALFPTANFLVTIDTEVILISSRSTDTFTVASGGRGYDNSVAATHSSGATVQLSICSYNLTHIWQNVADTYSPLVPPVQLGNSASLYDNEFEAAGSWVLFPTPGGSTTFAINSTLRSYLVLNRVSGDNANYFAYIPFTPGTSFTVTMRVSEATAVTGTSSLDEAQINFFVCDQSNPTGSPDTGNRFRVDTHLGTLNNTTNPRRVLVFSDVSGSPTSVSNEFPISLGVPIYLRITYNGSGTWTGYVGDGIAYTLLGTKTSFSFSPQTLGVCFQAHRPSGANISQIVAIDWVRVVTGSVLPPYGS